MSEINQKLSEQMSAEFFCKGTASKSFRLHGSHAHSGTAHSVTVAQSQQHTITNLRAGHVQYTFIYAH